MNLFNIFKKRVNYQRENHRIVRERLGEKQKEVYKAVAFIGYPCTSRQVARYLQWDTDSVSPRLTELVRKGQLKIAYTKKGLDRKWRKYYVAVHI